jgi:large subunit ribosomal protein L19
MAEETAKQATNEDKNDAKKTSTPVEKPKFDPRTLDLKSGLTVRVHQKIKETNTKGETKERIQVFEGRIIAKKHGMEPGATITVRKISEGIGVEKIFPLFSPNIENIEIKKEAKVRRAKLYFLRNYKKRLKEKLIS